MNEKINNSKFNASWLFTLLLPLIAGCAWLIYDFNSRPIPDKPNPGYNPKHLSSDQMKAFDPSFGFNRERILGEINVPQAGTRLPKYTNKLKMLVDADGNRSYPLGHTKNTRRQSISPHPPYLGGEGKVWASPFPKFFNYEEHDVSELPHGQKIEITQKMDGSLLIVFRYKDKVVYSTRGSFYSDQAIAGGQLFRELYEEDWVQYGLTYLFEYVGPDNRIVVNYEYDDLIHLGLINTQSGSDLPRDERFTCVSTYDVEGGLFGHDLYSKLKLLNTSNEEGFVIRAISDGDLPDWRCKIKFDDYCKLHKIVTGVSNKTIWENLRSNTSFDDILEITPDEFNDWLRITKKNFETDYELILAQAKMAYNEVKDLETRKDQAITLLANHKDISHIVFKMLNEQEYSSEIWDMLKPTKFVQPFSSKAEE